MLHTGEHKAYVAIGGIGGSGTRLAAEMIQQSGYFIGDDLNEAHDNLTFTLLFKEQGIANVSNDDFRLRLDILVKSLDGRELTDLELARCIEIADIERPQHSREWLLLRANRLAKARRLSSQLTGWKEPNTHLVIPRLFDAHENIRYVHIVRNGMQMAFSSNQNQPNFWGQAVLNRNLNSPEGSLEWWCYVQNRVLEFKKLYPTRIHIVRYEDLIELNPCTMQNFLEFIKIEFTANLKESFKYLLALMPQRSNLVIPRSINVNASQRAILAVFGYL